jgi:starch synthase (maltosyl-transferring)
MTRSLITDTPCDSAARQNRVICSSSDVPSPSRFPLLVGTVSQWAAELPRIAELGFNWVYLNPFHQTGGSRSLYAVADLEALDERFRDGAHRLALGVAHEQVRPVVEQAGIVGGVIDDEVAHHHAEHARGELIRIFDGYIARLQRLGVRGFRCDAAYKASRCSRAM